MLILAVEGGQQQHVMVKCDKADVMRAAVQHNQKNWKGMSSKVRKSFSYVSLYRTGRMNCVQPLLDYVTRISNDR